MNNSRMTFHFNQPEADPSKQTTHGSADRLRQVRQEPTESLVTEPAAQSIEEFKDSPSKVDKVPVPGHEDWDDPFGASASSWSSPAYWREKVSPVARVRRTSPWKIAGSVTSALMTGALFGYIVLAIFGDSSSVQAPSLENQAAVPVFSQEQGTLAELSVPPSFPVVKAKISPSSYYMLQYGVFSSEERALQAATELAAAGVASGRDTLEDNRVYAGISPDREQAKLLGGQMKTQGMELYVRQLDLPGADRLAFTGTPDGAEEYFTVSTELVHSLTTLSASLLRVAQPGEVQDSTMSELESIHQRWTESVTLLSKGIPGEAKSLVEGELIKSMNSAMSALSEYNKNKAKEHLWEVQSSMMKYVFGQRQLLEFIKQ